MSNCRRFWTFSKSAKNRNEYYKVLGVSKDASKQEIKEAYLKLSKSLHPDVNKSPNASQEFQKLKEAFDNLSEPSGFHSYDKDDNLKDFDFDHQGNLLWQDEYVSWKDSLEETNRRRKIM